MRADEKQRILLLQTGPHCHRASPFLTSKTSPAQHLSTRKLVALLHLILEGELESWGSDQWDGKKIQSSLSNCNLLTSWRPKNDNLKLKHQNYESNQSIHASPLTRCVTLGLSFNISKVNQFLQLIYLGQGTRPVIKVHRDHLGSLLKCRFHRF